MSLATFLSLMAFSFVSSVTPGPNNIMLFASGVNFGLRRTWPHAFGIAFGFGVLLGAVGAGLGVLIDQYPQSKLVLKVLGGSYMLYLAWKIANAGPVEVKEGAARPMRFYEAALFQWVNPKAWVMAISAMTAYTAEGDYSVNVGIVVFAFVVVNFPSVTIWAAFGQLMRDWLSDPKRLRIFNVGMALALVASLWPILLV
ncbi:LysE family translocator [Pseudahrensia aquimaris]|uniref:LysE family translocator n=1 Tax=Pseudahrensia aquimaris TaxID=744461 RepID=A0ABW3FGL4_9HYPH